MRDPFPAPPTALAAAADAYLARPLHLTTLPAHVHEILFAFGLYEGVRFASHKLAPRLLPGAFAALPRRTRQNWDLKTVSLVQALVICALALRVLATDDGIDRASWQGRVFGYSGATGFVQAMAAGYFAWDIYVSVVCFDILGPGSLLHGVAAFVVSLIGFRPFANYYGLAFVLYELSTPFLDFHWYIDKLGWTGTTLQLVNGILLILTFGGCRLVWGAYQSVLIYSDIWQAIQAHNGPGEKVGADVAAEVQNLPVALALTYLVGNTILTLLNFYWFGQMIKMLVKRFRKPEGPKKVKKQQ